MGTTYSPMIIFGVPEPPEWKNSKRIKEFVVQIRVCPNGHFKKGFQDGWKVCPECGSEPVKRAGTPRKEEIPPYEAYVPPGMPEGTDSYDYGCNSGLIHTSYEWQDVYLGVRLWYEQDLYFGVAEVPDPTEKQRAQLDAYLKHLGYDGPPPKTYLIMHAG